ncbi:MAG: ribonuclease E/G [Bacillota bacterium]|nr:ribonuclease E/G [Bacillota bacterium]
MNGPAETDQTVTAAQTELIVYRQQDVVCCVLTEKGKPVEVIRATAEQVLHRQDIVLGMVRQILPALSCAFIDIGDDHDALLPIAEASPDIKAGQRIIVQVRKETAPGKGHRVTTRIELPGPYAVLLPFDHPRRRSKLRGLPRHEQDALYSKDLERLGNIWQEILLDSRTGSVPRPLYPFGDPCYTALITWVRPELVRIRVDDISLYNELYRQLTELMPQSLPLLQYQRREGDFGLAAILGLTDLDEQLKRRTVLLDGGGFIVIDRTEALTAIDVNSGRDTRGRSGQQLRLRTNLQAAAVIAGQLRLRNIGGMVVIDFLRSTQEADLLQIEQTFRQSLEQDRARLKLFGFSAMGLFELTRSAL